MSVDPRFGTEHSSFPTLYVRRGRVPHPLSRTGQPARIRAYGSPPPRRAGGCGHLAFAPDKAKGPTSHIHYRPLLLAHGAAVTPLVTPPPPHTHTHTHSDG